MQKLSTVGSTRRQTLFLGAVTGAVGVLLAILLIPMTSAQAAPDGDHLVVDGCTIDLPFGYGYQANGDPIDAGTQFLATFYPSVTIDQLDGPDRLIVESIDIDVPLECAFEVSVTCDSATFHTYLESAWWSALRVDYGDEVAQPHTVDFTGDTVTIPLDYNPFHYVVVDEEMGKQFDGKLAPDCAIDDSTSTPTVAPASGV